jgi:DNA-binding transcriptional LysR family regulator
VERQEIEAFLALADELHFGRTAARLRLSTARVSQLVRRLERRVGAPLFARTSRSVALTALGRRFRDELAPAYQRVRDALDRASTAGRALRVGFLGPSAGEFVLAAMARLPDREVQPREVRIGDVPGALRSLDVDVLLTKFPVREPDLAVGPVLLREPRVLALPAAHPLAGAPDVGLDEVADDPHLDLAGPVPDYWRAVHLPAVAPGGAPIRRGPAAATMHEALLLVAAGRGVCGVAPGYARRQARPDVAFVPLRDAPPFESGLVWRSGDDSGPVREFARVAADLAAAG